MNKILYLSAAVVALAQISAPSFAMDPDRCGHSAPKKTSRFAVKKQQADRFDPPKLLNNAALLKIYGAGLTGTNKDEKAHALDQKLTGRQFAIGETGAYVDIDVNGVTIQAAHKEPASVAADRKLKAINSSPHVIAILDEIETKFVPTMGPQHESVGGKYNLINEETKEPVMSVIQSIQYSTEGAKEVDKEVETFVNIVFSRLLNKKQ